MVKVTKTDAEWREKLSDQQYYVCRERGTEQAFSGKYWNCDKQGVYHCSCCGEKLFSSQAKFDSGTGWPSFYAPVNQFIVGQITDKSYNMVRTEIVCNNCDSHLGHVFDDGPAPSGLRYCVNSASLELKEACEELEPA